MTTAVYEAATGRLVGYTTADNPGPNQIVDPLPEGLATKDLGKIDPGHPPAGFALVWNTDTLAFDQVALPRPAISTREFWLRFTAAEREALVAMAREGTAQQKTKLTAFKEYCEYGGLVDLDDPNIVDGVTLMEAAGLIGAGRAAEVLS